MADEHLIQRIQQTRQAVENTTRERLRLEARKADFLTELEAFKVSLREQGIEASQLQSLTEEAKQDVENKLTALETALNVS